MKSKIVSVIISLLPLIACAQNRITLNGYVKESKNGESLIGEYLFHLIKDKQTYGKHISG